MCVITLARSDQGYNTRMALFDYDCDECDLVYVDVFQEIGSERLPECPKGHSWKRLISRVTVDTGFKGLGSISPQMEIFNETGDPELAFPRGKPDDDAFTLADLTDHEITTNQR